MCMALRYTLGALVAASTAAFAGGGGGQTTTVDPSQWGHVYNPLTGRSEVDLDRVVSYCKGQAITVTISADRSSATASCKFPGTSYDHITQLPIMDQKQFAVFWSR